jgi:hypothetical protein
LRHRYVTNLHQIKWKFAHSFLEAHEEAFTQFGMLHRDIHLANLYIKNSDESESGGGVLGDWGFAECQKMSEAEKCLERIGYHHPIKPATVAPHSPSSIASSLTPPPSSPEPSLLYYTKGTARTRAAGTLRDYRESSITDSDLETKKPSAFSSSNKSKLNPWDRKTQVQLAERTVSGHSYTLHITVETTSIQGNASCVSIRMMLRSASDQRGGHKVCDDLESFFYAIVLMMVVFEAPGQYKSDEELAALNLDDMWWKPKPKDLAMCAKWKLATMKLDAMWYDNIADHFSPYFNCWKEPINEMRKTIFLHYDPSVRDKNQMCNTDGVSYSDILDILKVMVQVGTQADSAEAEQGSLADTDIVPTSDPLASLFSLEMVDDQPDGLNLTSPDPASYTPSEKLDITSSLAAVVATSEISEGAAFPSDFGHMPTRETILQHTRQLLVPQSLDTGELPSTLSEVTPRPAATAIKRKASTQEVVIAKKSRGDESEGDEVGASVVTAKKKSRGNDGGASGVVTIPATKRSKGSRVGAPAKKFSNRSRPGPSGSRRKGNDDDEEFLPGPVKRKSRQG